jgi:hypothetical protein
MADSLTHMVLTEHGSRVSVHSVLGIGREAYEIRLGC